MQIEKTEIEALIDEKLKNAEKQFGKKFKSCLVEIISLEKMLNPKPAERPRLIPLVKWNEFYPDPSVKALRMYCFNKEKNGFSGVIERRGHRILINEQKFFEWQANQAN